MPVVFTQWRTFGFQIANDGRGRFLWRLHILDLNTGHEAIVNETRSVDDQAEWLDNDHLLYGLPRNVAGSASTDIWLARADDRHSADVFSQCFLPLRGPAMKQETTTVSSIEEEREGTSHVEALKSTSIIGGSTAITILIRMVRTKVLAILLGPAGIGLEAIYDSVISLARIGVDMGISSSGVRQIASAVGSGSQHDCCNGIYASPSVSIAWIDGRRSSLSHSGAGQ